jgi:hypothetical protein
MPPFMPPHTQDFQTAKGPNQRRVAGARVEGSSQPHMAPNQPPAGAAAPVPLAVIGSSIQLPGDINDRERFLEVIRDKVQVRLGMVLFGTGTGSNGVGLIKRVFCGRF